MENRRSLQKEHWAAKITRTSLNYAVCLIVIRNEILDGDQLFFCSSDFCCDQCFLKSSFQIRQKVISIKGNKYQFWTLNFGELKLISVQSCWWQRTSAFSQLEIWGWTERLNQSFFARAAWFSLWTAIRLQLPLIVSTRDVLRLIPKCETDTNTPTLECCQHRGCKHCLQQDLKRAVFSCPAPSVWGEITWIWAQLLWLASPTGNFH